MDKKPRHRATFSIIHMPEMIFTLRQEMSKFLLEEAGAEPNPVLAKRFRELAAAFEVGATGAQGRALRKKHNAG